MKLIIDGVIFENNSLGGIARMFNNILPLMCDLDPDLRIKLFFNRTPRIPYPEHPQISYLHLEKVYNYFRPWRLWKPYYKKLQKIFLKMKIGNSHNTIWLSTYFTRPPSGFHGKEIVYVYDMIYELFPNLLSNSDIVIRRKQECIMAADKVFCISNTTMHDLQNLYPIANENIIAIHLSKDKLFFKRSKTKIQSLLRYKYILYIGTRRFYKGFDTLMQAYSKWVMKDNIKLVVVGTEWSEEELNEIRAKGLDSQIILLQNTDDETLCELYNQAEAFIYPSLYEGFGIPLLEAMACGCQVIASKIPSTVEVAGDVPIFFAPGNIPSLMDAFNVLIAEEGKQERINRGIEKASQYSWEKTAKRFYQELIKLHDRN